MLYEVDKKNKTMSLKKVKRMGTESSPNDEMLGSVKFRVDLIKTFKIIEDREQEDDDMVDPAIVAADAETTPAQE